MNKRGREIADWVERKKVNIMCVQETKWKGMIDEDMGFKVHPSCPKETITVGLSWIILTRLVPPPNPCRILSHF